MKIESQALVLDDHFPIALEWANKWWSGEGESEEQLDKNILPSDGVITFINNEPAVITFQYFSSNSDVSFLAFLISNPNIDGRKTLLGVDDNLSKSKELSFQRGCKYQLCLLEHEGLSRRMIKKYGYSKGQENMKLIYTASENNNFLQQALMD